MPSIGESAHFTGDDNTLDGRAKTLWAALVAECTRRKIPVRRTPHGEGYLWNGSLQAVAAVVWPNLRSTKGKSGSPNASFVSTIRNHLKSNKNVIFAQDRGQLFISAVYHEPKVKQDRVQPVGYLTAPA